MAPEKVGPSISNVEAGGNLSHLAGYVMRPTSGWLAPGSPTSSPCQAQQSISLREVWLGNCEAILSVTQRSARFSTPFVEVSVTTYRARNRVPLPAASGDRSVALSHCDVDASARRPFACSSARDLS